MASLLKYIFFLVFIALGKSEMCSDNVTMYDLPKGVAAGMITIATTGIVVGFTGCPDKYQVEPDKIGFWLWNKENHDTPLKLNADNPTQINPNNKIIFIIHGWTCNITGAGFPEMKNAYLKRYPDANIISVEWTTYSVELYVNSFCYVPEIAELVGKFICNLNSKLNVDVNQLHVVGHSLGAQMAGLSGQVTKRMCKKMIGRITGLDPAGPLYQMVAKSRRLDASDATMVDVIHSNQGQFGYYGSCGTVDYYPNCGYLQPGCIELKPTMDITKLMNLPFSILACSHQRSIELFNESILSDNFKAKSCSACPGVPPVGPCVADLFKPSSSVMGENYEKYPGKAAKYYLRTNSEGPFARS